MHCGAALGLAEYTPEHLLRSVLRDRGAVEGARKQVTVLFVDIKDSVAWSTRVGPDHWHEILESFFRLLAREIHQYEGTINQYTGDGIMALFSAPIALEDHAERACRAALAIRSARWPLGAELRARHGLTLEIRIGINSGEAVVGPIGGNIRMDYTALGQTVGLAARLEAACPAGEILISEHTARLLQQRFILQTVGPLTFKGVPPTRVSKLMAIAPSDSDSLHPYNPSRTPLFGREAQFKLLLDALETAENGCGRVLGVSAEAGTGKTRLSWEFLAHCMARGLKCHVTRCAAHDRSRPLSSLLPLLRSCFGVASNDDEMEARGRIAQVLSKQLGAAASETLPLVLSALEMAEDPDAAQPAIDPEARMRQLKNVLWTPLLDAEPRLLVIDDAHWIDPVSGELLAALVDVVRASRVLLIVNFRPHYTAPFMSAEHYTALRLSPLGRADVDALLSHWVGRDASLAELFERVHDRARGNALFVEEILRSLIEAHVLTGTRGDYRLSKPIDELAVPATVQNILAARIDRLEPATKRTLQAAAVIGSEFTCELVADITGQSVRATIAALDALRSGEFVQSAMGAAAPRYVFRHPLLREVAYGALLVQQRRQMHARIAAVLTRDSQRREHADAALIAYHFESAKEMLQAAQYYRHAARHAGPAHIDRSNVYWRKVAELAALCTESPLATRHELVACMQLLNLAWRRGIDRSAAEQLYRRAMELMPDAGTDSMRALLISSYGRVLCNLDGADFYVERTSEALGIAHATGDASLIVSLSAMHAQALCRAGRLEASVKACDCALAASSSAAAHGSRGLDFDAATWILLLRGNAHYMLGRLHEAERDLQLCLTNAAQHGDVDLLIAPRVHLVEVAHYRGEGAALQPIAREAVELAERVGHTLAQVHAYLAAGLVALARGAALEAEQRFKAAVEIAGSRLGGLEFVAPLRAYLAEALLRQARVSEAVQEAERAVASARALNQRVAEAQALIVLCSARSELGTTDVAELQLLLDGAARLTAETGARMVLPLIAIGRARLAARYDLELDVAATFARAEHMLRDMGARARADDLRERNGPASTGV